MSHYPDPFYSPGEPSSFKDNAIGNDDTYSAEETAHLFFQHLLDNVGQFQQLYDGLFRWKMNDGSSLPSFSSIRPHFLHLLLSAKVNSSGVAQPSGPADQAIRGEDSDEDAAMDRMTNSMGESILNQILESAERPVSRGSTPFETASESGHGFTDLDTSGEGEQYGAIVGAPRTPPRPPPRRRNPTKDDYWDPDNLRPLYERVSPPKKVNKDHWLTKPLDPTELPPELDEEFDFERNLAAFKKIPLQGEVAKVASINAKKQDRAIKRLIKHARSK